MSNYKIYNSIKFTFYGWIFSTSEIRKSTNKMSYVIIRCCSYKNEWWNFIVYENRTDLSKLQKGVWLKMSGNLKVDENNRIFTTPNCVEILDSTKIDNQNLPTIEEEEEDAYEDEELQDWN